MTKPSIKNELEYQAILDAIELLLEAEPGTPEAAELEALTKLVDAYDDIHYPINE
jgi:HTH-type transcriptional regulator/antitoxin HigA